MTISYQARSIVFEVGGQTHPKNVDKQKKKKQNKTKETHTFNFTPHFLVFSSNSICLPSPTSWGRGRGEGQQTVRLMLFGGKARC
mgnify:CR=1 FL=1